MAAVLDKLSTDQVKKFDREHMQDHRWGPLSDKISRRFPTGEFSFLDLGGGNGMFTDRVLRHFQKARGLVLDSSEYLISKNAPSDRKRVVLGSAANIEALGEKFDLVFCHFLMHHLVTSRNYRQTRDNIATVLRSIRGSLTLNGAVSIFEHNCDGYIDGFSSWLVFSLTSSRILKFIIKRLGANTAGVGVCFLSHRQWMHEVGRAGFQLTDYWEDDPWVSERWKFPRYKASMLLARNIGAANYWLT
jgi:SAM-dependent methyltransferase